MPVRAVDHGQRRTHVAGDLVQRQPGGERVRRVRVTEVVGVSLLHKAGLSWAEIGGLVGQTDLATTANTYSHVVADYREVDRKELL